MGGRTWMMLSVLSGALAIGIFGAVLFASGGHPVAIVSAMPEATPGQPVDTPFIYYAPNPGRPAAQPSPAAPTASPSPNGGQAATVGTSASENNAAPDISAPPNPFTAGIR